MEKTKKCPQCGRELPLSAFGKNRSKKDGLASWCKECNRKYRSESRQQSEQIEAKEHRFHVCDNPLYERAIREEVIGIFNKVKESINERKNIAKYFNIRNSSITLVADFDERIKADTATYATKEKAKDAYKLHREIAKQLNTLADLLKNIPRDEFAKLDKFFYQSEEGTIQASPVDYDLFT